MKNNLIKGILSVCLFASIGANIVQARTIEFKQNVIMSFARDSIQQKETIKNLQELINGTCQISTPYSAAISTAYSAENGGAN